MTIKNKSKIERALGILEGLGYGISDNNIADGLFNAIEMIEAAFAEDEQNAAD